MQNILTKKTFSLGKQKFFGLFLAIFACGALVESHSVVAASTPEASQRIIKFDKATVQFQAKMYRKLQELLTSKMQSIEAAMKKETEELQKDASLMQNFNEKQKANFEKRHKAFRDRAEAMQQTLMQLKDLLERETNDNTQEAIQAVIKELSSQGGWDKASIIVMDSAAIAYSSDGVLDITALVIKHLDEKHPSISEHLEKKIQEIGLEKK